MTTHLFRNISVQDKYSQFVFKTDIRLIFFGANICAFTE
jgi:hypothetical protein